MKSKYHSLKKLALAALVFGALAQPAWTATINIDGCREITQPGAYKLTKDLDGQSLPDGRACFRLKASNITLDLGGHTVRGINDHLINGVEGWGNGIKVRNGGLLSFFNGVSLPFSFGTVIEQLKVIANNRDGLELGNGAQIQQVKAINNSLFGIKAGAGAYVNSVDIESNGDHGLVVGPGSRVFKTSSYFNGGHGIFLDHSSFGDTAITANTTGANGGTGIWADCVGSLIRPVESFGLEVTGNYRDPFFPNSGPDIIANVPDVLVPGPGVSVDPEYCKALQPGTIIHRSDNHSGDDHSHDQVQK